MAKTTDDVLIQLATRIPRSLHRDIKLYCVANGMSLMEFVASALDAKLRRSTKTTRRASR